MPNIECKNGICRIRQQRKTISWTKANNVPLLEQDGLWFKDLARTGQLLPYEDWRLPAAERARDLAGRMSIEQIAGLMLYSPHQAVPPQPNGPFGGTFGGKPYAESGAAPSDLSDQQLQFLKDEHIRHILLTTVESASVSA